MTSRSSPWNCEALPHSSRRFWYSEIVSRRRRIESMYNACSVPTIEITPIVQSSYSSSRHMAQISAATSSASVLVDLVDGLGAALDVVGDQVRLDAARRRLAQRPDLAVVAEVVAELDDVRHAAEVLQQPDRPTERLAGEVVDRRAAVVELLVGDVLEHLVDEPLDGVGVVADGVGADLLVVADHRDLAGQTERDETEHVALARLVDDDDVELAWSPGRSSR